MRILVVTHYYDAHGGGVEIVARRLIDHLAQAKKYRFVWAASDGDDLPDGTCVAALPMAACNIAERRLGFPWPLWSPVALGGLNKAVKEADIVWLHDTLYMGNMAAYVLARWHGKKVLVTQHIGLVPYRNPVLRFMMKAATRLIGETLLRRADQTVFISDRVAEACGRRMKFRRSPRMIANGVDTDLFYPVSNKAGVRRTWGLAEGRPVLLFVGRFVEKKGLAVLAELARRMTDVVWVFAGHGPMAPEAWNLPHVRVFRDRRGRALAELYQMADLLVLPSVGEGFPLVVQEALACGLPVLCGPETAQGSLAAREVLQVAEIVAYDPVATARLWHRKIEACLAHPAESGKLVACARAAWSWSDAAARYEEIFAELGGA